MPTDDFRERMENSPPGVCGLGLACWSVLASSVCGCEPITWRPPQHVRTFSNPSKVSSASSGPKSYCPALVGRPRSSSASASDSSSCRRYSAPRVLYRRDWIVAVRLLGRGVRLSSAWPKLAKALRGDCMMLADRRGLRMLRLFWCVGVFRGVWGEAPSVGLSIKYVRALTQTSCRS